MKTYSSDQMNMETGFSPKDWQAVSILQKLHAGNNTSQDDNVAADIDMDGDDYGDADKLVIQVTECCRNDNDDHNHNDDDNDYEEELVCWLDETIELDGHQDDDLDDDNNNNNDDKKFNNSMMKDFDNSMKLASEPRLEESNEITTQ